MPTPKEATMHTNPLLNQFVCWYGLTFCQAMNYFGDGLRQYLFMELRHLKQHLNKGKDNLEWQRSNVESRWKHIMLCLNGEKKYIPF